MSGVILTPEEWETHQRLVQDYEFFSRHIQRIDPKDLVLDEEVKAKIEALEFYDPDFDDVSIQGTIPLIFHPGQVKLHRFVTDMKSRRGLVKAALVKPRQVGWSTYIHGRGHWLASKTPGMKIQIVSHTAESTSKFLRRIKKMCKAAPPMVTPGRQVDNAREMIFANGASYAIATAGSPDAVRSDSCHFFHGSEETSWKDAIAVLGSIIPALSGGLGSEAYRETTSKGRNTPWHNFILETQAGENDWEVFFDAWFNHPKYQLTPPPGWEPSDDDKEARNAYPNVILTDAQLYWRRMKIKELRALWLFKQEFPGTIDESFQSSADTLYPPDAVYRAAKNGAEGKLTLDEHAPLIMGVDPARSGDRTVIAFRQGNVFREIITWAKMDDMRLVGIIAKFLNEGYRGKKVAMCFMDYAIGEGPASRLRELGHHRRVTTVNFGEGATEDRYANKRAEMFIEMRDWFGDSGEYVSIPPTSVGGEGTQKDDVIADLLAIPDFVQADGSDKIKLVRKDLIKKELGHSPDIADAMALTFAYPVAGEKVAELQEFIGQNLPHLDKTALGAVLRDFEQA